MQGRSRSHIRLRGPNVRLARLTDRPSQYPLYVTIDHLHAPAHTSTAPRHHTLNALSPLQSFSPLQPLNIPPTSKSRQHSRHPSYNSISSVGSSPSTSFSGVNGGGGGLGITTHNSHSNGGHRMPPLSTYNLNKNNQHGPSSPGGPLELESFSYQPHGGHYGNTGGGGNDSRPRTPSVTRSLSRRESIVAGQGNGGMMHHFESVMGGGAGGYSPGPGSPQAGMGHVHGDRGGGMSKLTLVRAPSKGRNLVAQQGGKAVEDGTASGASTPGGRR